MRVLFIVGSGRSGSTLLDMLLGQIDGFFSTGELHSIWSESILDGRRCGCGQPVVGCSVWSDVLERTVSGRASTYEEAVRLARLHRALTRWNRLLWRSNPAEGVSDYADHAARLYQAITEVTGARVTVDSSKHPAVAAMLPRVAGVRPSYVHLVRDPRAVAHSWRRRKVATDRYGMGEMDRYVVPRTALRWVAEQRAAEALRRWVDAPWMTLRYEDLVGDPRGTVDRILRLVDMPPAPTAFLEAPTLSLARTHTVSGNPIRLQDGPLRIEPDDEWMTAMRPSRRWLVALLAAPVMRRYGYGRTTLTWRDGSTAGEAPALLGVTSES